MKIKKKHPIPMTCDLILNERLNKPRLNTEARMIAESA